jgi:hypothetical protein
MNQVFTLMGHYTENGKTHFSVNSLDFTTLKIPQCKGTENPDSQSSDYETWTPNDYRHGDAHCLLGKRIKYDRRKQLAECFNGEQYDRKVITTTCECSEEDYECDYGFRRPTSDAPCEQVANMTERATVMFRGEDAPDDCYDFYEVSRGYRRVASNSCFRGVDLSPI